MPSLSPEEQERIAEEQRIRNKETLKAGVKTLGKMYLIIGGIFVLLMLFACLFFTGVLSSLGG